jgi:hypothetical protein
MRISRTPVGSGLGFVTRWFISPLLLAFIALLLFYSPVSRVNAAPDDTAFNFEGFHDAADCTQIYGWAWDASQPTTPINVDIYVDNVFSMTVPANQFRQDLLDAGKGNGEHGFSFPTPEALKDGQPHEIRVRIAGSNIDLGNTPRTITCNPHAYEGFHDAADCTQIYGWAWDANQPNTPINVDIHIDGHPFVDIQAPANQFRQDLLNAGKGNGVHGFSFPTPNSLKNGMPHTIRITFSGTNTDLQLTPKTITCMGNTPPALEGFFDFADCSILYGWAWDANQPNTPISVDIYDGPNKIATVLADQFRQDLLNAGKGNGVHGFSLATPASLKNGQPHSLAVGYTGTFNGLSNNPKVINCPVGFFEGFHDVADCTQIYGWAWDSGQPNTPISVDIYADGFKFATVQANRFRQSLVDAGKGNGFHEFFIPTPNELKNGQPHEIRVRVVATTFDLDHTPKTITCLLPPGSPVVRVRPKVIRNP